VLPLTTQLGSGTCPCSHQELYGKPLLSIVDEFECTLTMPLAPSLDSTASGSKSNYQSLRRVIGSIGISFRYFASTNSCRV
jgi:hypothetical protein